MLYRLVSGLLTWLDEYPDDQVDPNAVASIRQSIGWVIGWLPAQQRDRLAAGDPGPEALKTVAGLFADLMWWLDTCTEDEVDLHVAVNLQESSTASIDELPDGQRRRLLEIFSELAATEPHDGRRYELLFLPFAIGLTENEPSAERPAAREWISPEARTGPA